MTIGVDLRFLGVDRRGMGRYVGALSDRLLERVAGTHDLVLLAEPRSVTAAERLRLASATACRVVTAREFEQASLDACWLPWGRADVRSRARRVVVTLHDLAALRYPPRGWLRALDRRHDARRVTQVIERADVVAVVSAFVRDELIDRLAVDPSRIAIVSGGVDPAWGVPAAAARLAEPFILWVGNDEERKNLGALLRAFGRVRAGGWRGRLVLCGHNPDLLRRHAQTIAACGVADSLVVEDNPDDEALRARYRDAALFVFPSLYEGFGLPVLEAMAAGTPVACTRAASLPEVAGDAAEYFDPRDVDDMARAMRRCLDDEPHARKLAAAGVARVARFSWDASAERLQKVLEGCPGSEDPGPTGTAGGGPTDAAVRPA